LHNPTRKQTNRQTNAEENIYLIGRANNKKNNSNKWDNRALTSQVNAKSRQSVMCQNGSVVLFINTGFVYVMK